MAGQDQRTRRRKAGPASAPYSSKIIKAGALLDDSKTLLSQWDLDSSVPENLKRIRQENLLGKASRSRVEDILGIFRQRFLDEECVTRALVALVRNRLPSATLDRILYFHSAKSDCLLYDVVTEVLVPLKAAGISDVGVPEITRTLQKWVNEGKTKGPWSASTIQRIAQGLLATLRDFGVLQGATHKRIAPVLLPVEAFAYIMFYLKLHQPSGAKLIEHPDWKLFFLSPDGVERFLFEGHQKGLLEYYAAGTVTRLNFPASTLEEYANVLAQRAH